MAPRDPDDFDNMPLDDSIDIDDLAAEEAEGELLGLLEDDTNEPNELDREFDNSVKLDDQLSTEDLEVVEEEDEDE